MAKKFDSAIDEIMNAGKKDPKPDNLVNRVTGNQGTTKPGNSQTTKTIKPGKEPTERLDVEIPKSLNDRLLRYLFEGNLNKKKGKKLTKTSEAIKALDAHLQNANY